MKKGALYLIPTTLGSDNTDYFVPPYIKEIINGIDHYVVENEKPSRRYLRKLDIAKPIVELEFFTLNKHTSDSELASFMKPLEEGKNMGLISDAGCPGVADPGAVIVKMAHQKGIKVIPLIGPSSILLALMASGMNGQGFAFNGYLPKERKNRIRKIVELEKIVQKSGSTQIFMDTPFRNNHVLQDILANLSPSAQLCIAADITMDSEFIQTKTVGQWNKNKPELHKRPCLFLLGN